MAAAIINTNYALEAGFNPAEDALVIEGAESPYVNVVAVKSGNENGAAVQALLAALQSEAVRDFINAQYQGAVAATF